MGKCENCDWLDASKKKEILDEERKEWGDIKGLEDVVGLCVAPCFRSVKSIDDGCEEHFKEKSRSTESGQTA